MKAQNMPDWRLVFTLVGGSLMVAGAFAAEPAAPTKANLAVPGLVQYQTPTGENYAALILPAPPVPRVQTISHDHVLIVDTSASQSGSFRTRSLSVAAAFAAALPADDRLLLLAADVSADDLTFGFAQAHSPELAAGFDRLNDRVPLGSSNLELALKTSLKSLTAKGPNARRGQSILYIGDGFSTAQLIQSPRMKELVGKFRDSAVPISTFGVGPRLDLVLLGTIAQHTGGCVKLDEPNLVAEHRESGTDAAKLGRELVQAAKSPVFYPDEISSKPEFSGIQPTLLPPVRFDRETILLGEGLRGTTVFVRMSGSLAGQLTSFSWNIESEVLGGSTCYIYQAWKQAQASHGVAMPFAGRDMLMKSHDQYQTQLNDLVDSGLVQLQRKNYQQAEQIAESLQQLDPSNVKARQILARANQIKTQPVKHQRIRQLAQADGAEENPAAEEIPAPDEAPNATNSEPGEAPAPGTIDVDLDDRSDPKNDSLLEELTSRQQVRIEELTAEVNQVIDVANRIAATDFENAAQMVKDLIDSVDSALELPESVRRPLRRRLDTSLQKLQNDNEIAVQKSAALRTKLSGIQAHKKLLEQAERDEERMQQLIERVRALITRGVKGEETAFEEAEEYSRIAVELDPYNYVPNLDLFNSEAYGALDKARRMRALRADKFLAALYEVERAHVPFPDEPPVLWPSAERWREITIKREKWKSVDLKNYSKQEEKIVTALNRPMKEKFDFVDATLEDVRNKLMEVYEINVVIDKVKLEEETIATDTADINLVISDIMLKNALKLLLEPKNLTYSIQDEVLKITTKTDGAGKKPIKAVYAGDLATPINPLFGTGGSGAGGQQGGGGQLNGGQQGGGFGGGAQGFGGGGGGGGFGGGGGNFFNVPPPQLKPKQNPNGVQPKAVLPNGVNPNGAQDQPGFGHRSNQKWTGQAFAQIKDQGASGALNGETLKARKKKALTAR